MKQVLITDYTFDALDVERAILEPAGFRVEAHRARTPEELIGPAAEADAVITQFVPLTAEVIAAMAKAKIIVRYGIGVDSVDLAAAKAKNIPVSNIPDYCIDEVADHTLAFVLGLTRRVTFNSLFVHGGSWGLGGKVSDMKCLRDLTVGVAGFGRIGRAVVERLRPFRCKVRVFDPFAPVADVLAAGAEAATDLSDLLATSDVLSLHCPSNAQTRKMIDDAALAKMRPGSLLVNVARGDLVDTPALVEALRSGHLAGAALDVCDQEPIPAGHALLGMSNVILASHVASVSEKAVRTLRETAARLVVDRLAGKPLRNVVNGVTV